MGTNFKLSYYLLHNIRIRTEIIEEILKVNRKGKPF